MKIENIEIDELELLNRTRPTVNDLLYDDRDRIPSNFDVIGYSQLQKQPKPKSIPSSLLQRELGFPSYREGDGGWQDVQIYRKLLVARGPETKNSICCKPQPLVQDCKQKLSNQPASSGVWSRMKLVDFSNAERPRNARCDFLDEKIMIEESYGSHTIRRIITVNPTPGNYYHLEFKLVAKGKKKIWNSHDVWYVGDTLANPYEKKNQVVLKVSNTLFALEDNKLLLFNVNNGKKISELSLTFPKDSFGRESPTYTWLSIDNETDRIYVEASRSCLCSKNKDEKAQDLLHEVLIFAYPPLSLLYRVQIPKEVIGSGYTYATNIGSMFLLFKPNAVEIMDFEKMLNQEENLNLSTLDFKTVVIKVKPRPLLMTINTKNNYLAWIPSIWPPHVLTKSKTNFEIYGLQYLETPIASFPYDDMRSDSSVYSYCSGPRVVYAGLPYGLEILDVGHVIPAPSRKSSIETVSTCIRTLFSTTIAEIKSESTADLGQRNSKRLRNIARKFYGGDQKGNTYGFDYNPMMDLFAVCIISNATNVLEVTLYDNFSMKEFKKLQPVQLVVPRNDKEFSFSKIEVHFQNSFLSVKVTLLSNIASKDVELYIINLLSEEP